jgi:tetratricopeptide (TPR) repeat protein
LFDDLAAGRKSLEATLRRAECLAPGLARRTIEAHALAGLVDNAVFGGDLVRAGDMAVALRERMPGLAKDVLIEVHQVLIEAAMRQGDFVAAHASLEGLRQAGAAPAVVLSFEAQLHWFAGAVSDARQVFEHLLARFPDYCQGLTIENDLAVMCHALGDLGAAEGMARRSLRSWAGVAHTEALSSLVLGSTLTSMGRIDEALAAFDRAYDLGQQQRSSLFTSEALSRRARAHWCAGKAAMARDAAAAARKEAINLVEPLRASGLALTEVLASAELQGAAEPAALAALETLRDRSRHPVVHARYWRARIAAAECRRDAAGALDAARRQADVARQAGLLEWLCEALGLTARFDSGAAAAAAQDEAQSLAHSQGFGWLTPTMASFARAKLTA